MALTNASGLFGSTSRPVSLFTPTTSGRAPPVVATTGTVRVDPNPDPNGALTAVFSTQGLLVTITYGSDRPLADQILTSFVSAPAS